MIPPCAVNIATDSKSAKTELMPSLNIIEAEIITDLKTPMEAFSWEAHIVGYVLNDNSQNLGSYSEMVMSGNALRRT